MHVCIYVAPRLVVNGSESVTVNFMEENERLVLLSGSTVTITDDDSARLSGATLTLDHSDASLESLRVDASMLPQGVAPQTPYQSDQGLLTISGSYSIADYESILSAVEYVNTNPDPDDRIMPIVVCRVRDESGSLSNNVTIVITVVEFNDPPVIYLGGPSQVNYSVTLPEMGSSGLPIVNSQVQIQDPDTMNIISIEFILEPQTINGGMINFNVESLISPTGLLNQDSMNQNVYHFVLNSGRPTGHSNYESLIPQVGYVNTNPEAVVPGTRIVRVTALDEELITNAGSRLPRTQPKPSFTFINVRNSEVPTTQTPIEQTPQPTTTETKVELTTTPFQLDATISGDSMTSPDAQFTSTQSPQSTSDSNPGISNIDPQSSPARIHALIHMITGFSSTSMASTTETNPLLMCPEELNVPLLPESTTGLLIYNWTQTPKEEDHMGQQCPPVSLYIALSCACTMHVMCTIHIADTPVTVINSYVQVCQDLARINSEGRLRRRCSVVVREGKEVAEWSQVDFTECGLSMTALQLCESSLSQVNPACYHNMHLF